MFASNIVLLENKGKKVTQIDRVNDPTLSIFVFTFRSSHMDVKVSFIIQFFCVILYYKHVQLITSI